MTSLLVSFALVGGAAADPFYGLFRYDDPVPLAGDCGRIAAAIGPENTWYGQYSGKYVDGFTDRVLPYAARGCFESEYACRVWQNEAMTYSNGGPTYHTSCRPAVASAR
jgi:hypothetical protein